MRRDPRLLAVLVVALVAGGIAWANTAMPPRAKAAAPRLQSIPVTQSTLVCPQAGGAPSNGAARIAYADSESDPAAVGSALTAQPLDPDAVASALQLHPGHAWVVDGPKTLAPVELSVSGPLATAASAVQFTREQGGSTLQAAAVPCESPTTDAWFAGFSSGVGAHATLLLSNVDSVPATVDVAMYGDTSPPDTTADQGLVVAPHTQAAVRLDELVPGLANAVAHVVVKSGRVVPAVRYDAENGSIPIGFEWVPRTDAPALTQTVPGIVAGDGSRRLVLADPGDIDATVAVKIVTSDGSYTPSGFDTINVPAGQVTTVDLAAQLHGAAAGVVVTSTEPVVAGGIATVAPDKRGGSDIAFTGAVPALSGPTLVAGGETGANRGTRLLLSAPDADAHLNLTLLASAAASAPVVRPLTVPAGTTLTVDLASLSHDPAPAVELEPQGGGPVFAAWTLEEHNPAGADLTSFPLRSVPQTLQRPPATFDLQAGLPAAPVAPPRSPSQAPSSPVSSSDVPSSEVPSSDLPSSDAPGAQPSSSPPSSQPSP
jgi:hypothetical protein